MSSICRRSASHRAPRLHENDQTAAIQGVFEFDGFGLDEGATGEGLGDEFTHVGRELGDVANSAGSRPVGSAEGLANQIGDVGFAVSAGFGGLNKHLLPLIQMINNTANSYFDYC